MHFKIQKKLKNSLGRVGILETPHGIIHTPAFVAVGTKATVKSLNPEQIKDVGAEIVLGNTYHLYLQPGDEIVRDAGGIGKFMNWKGPTITDSGGFQVFSLGAAYGKQISKIASVATHNFSSLPTAKLNSSLGKIMSSYASSPTTNGEWLEAEGVCPLVKITEDGVSFKSHLDGSIHYITPEKSIQIQHNLGADIIFAFDECTSPVEDLKYQEEALERTHRWAERSLKEHKKLEKEKKVYLKNLLLHSVDFSPTLSSPFPALFGIVQGGRNEKFRKKSAKFIGSLDFDGFGIGGSFAKEDISSAVKWVNEILPEEKPRHLLGIGKPEDLFMGIENGVDLFDCVAPTRLGRNGTIYTKNGKIIIMNTKFRNDFSPIEEDCECYTCGGYSRAYIAHLFHGKEMLAGTLASIHNLYFIVNLVKKIRQSILDDNFFEFKKEFLKNYKVRKYI